MYALVSIERGAQDERNVLIIEGSARCIMRAKKGLKSVSAICSIPTS